MLTYADVCAQEQDANASSSEDDILSDCKNCFADVKTLPGELAV
jgi:hypothetical protein